MSTTDRDYSANELTTILKYSPGVIADELVIRTVPQKLIVLQILNSV